MFSSVGKRRGRAFDRIVNITVFESHGRSRIYRHDNMLLFRLSRDEIRRAERTVGASAAYAVYGSRLQLRNSRVEWKNEIIGYGTKAWRVVRKH